MWWHTRLMRFGWPSSAVLVSTLSLACCGSPAAESMLPQEDLVDPSDATDAVEDLFTRDKTGDGKPLGDEICWGWCCEDECGGSGDLDQSSQPEPGGFLWPCLGNEDCDSEYCVPFVDGTVCTSICVEECPLDWQCRAAPNAWPDLVFICLPPVDRLCAPCASEVDCASTRDLCWELGEGQGQGTFCLMDCALKACPQGYTCKDFVDPEDPLAKRKQCYPDTDSCICKPGVDGTSQPCTRTTDVGTCAGTETCDGVYGWVGCTALEAIPEKCDGLDNDCNGVVDNGCDDDQDGYCDASMDRVGTPAICPKGGGDCDDADPMTWPGAPEYCNGRDNNCDGVPDVGFVDCPSDTCTGGGDSFFETGAAACVEGKCVNPDTVGCGLFTCALGGASGEVCATSCDTDDLCVPSAHCDGLTSKCVLDFVNGQPCLEPSDCVSGHCQNGFCCADGDCCSQPVHCPAMYWEEAACDDDVTCQGTRKDAVCVDSVCAMGPSVPDDSACGPDILAIECSPYLPRHCTGAKDQPVPACATSCTNHNQCLPEAHCGGGICIPDLPPGVNCQETAQCQAGNHCVDGVCCNTVCSGSCMRCNLPGAEGICSHVPNGQDPDSECGTVSCSGHFWGWSGSSCHLRADVAADVASCNGAGSCQSAADLCSGQGLGAIANSCHPTCQSPNLATCVGTNAGSCLAAGCLPGQVAQTQACGHCLTGSQQKVCTDSCEVPVSWTPCVGGGACAAQSVETDPSTNCNQKTCSDSCTWGAWQPARKDGYEANESKAGAYSLGEISYNDDDMQLLYANFHTASDVDWFQYRTKSEVPYLADPEVTLSVPVQATQSYHFWVEFKCRSGGDTSSKEVIVAPGTQATLGWGYSLNRCGFGRSHEMDLWIQVKPVNATTCSGCCLYDYWITYRG